MASAPNLGCPCGLSFEEAKECCPPPRRLCQAMQSEDETKECGKPLGAHPRETPPIARATSLCGLYFADARECCPPPKKLCAAARIDDESKDCGKSLGSHPKEDAVIAPPPPSPSVPGNVPTYGLYTIILLLFASYSFSSSHPCSRGRGASACTGCAPSD